MICPKCGFENDYDAEYCVNCALKLNKEPIKSNKIERIESKSEGMKGTTKALIIGCVILVGALVLVGGYLLQSSGSNSQYQVASNTETENQTYAPEWHEIADFTGTLNETRSVSIKGDRFRVVISAVPLINYGTNDFRVDVFKDQGLVSNGYVAWEANEKPDKKEYLMEVPQGNGEYRIEMYNYDVEYWEVKVYDYY